MAHTPQERHAPANGDVETWTAPKQALREWRWAILWAAGVVALTSLPYLVGWLNTTSEVEFGGLIYDTPDAHSYLAKMLQGAEGSWLFRLPYTSEAHDGGPFFLFYLILGKLCAATGLSMVGGYHLARLSCGMLLLLSAYRLMACLIPWRAVRRIAYLMTCLGSGFGWLAMALGVPQELGHMPFDLWSPDGFAFVAIYGFPHMCFSQAMILQSLLWGYRGVHSLRWRDWTQASMTALLASLVHPYSVVMVCGILGAYVALRGVREHRVPWQAGLRVGFVALPSVPYIGWVVQAFSSNPAFVAWRVQSPNPSPSPLWLVTGYGLAMPLALLGAKRAWRTTGGRFALLWGVLNVLAIYVPFSFQRRLISGFQVPLTVLAAVGLVQVLIPWTRQFWRRGAYQRGRYTRRGVTRLLVFGVLVLMIPTNLVIVGGGVLATLLRTPGLFHSVDQMRAIDELTRRAGNGDVVLASLPESNYLPTRASLRVVWGLPTETIGFETKRQQVNSFFSTATLHSERQALLREHNVAYVLHGPNERAMGGFEPGDAGYLTLVALIGQYAIYSVAIP